MTHLGDRITDYVFEELSTSEMAEARTHIQQCEACRRDVERLQMTHALLKATPDVEPPRRIVFEVEKKSRFSWNWAVPMAAAAALLLAVFIALPLQVQWEDSQVTIAFGEIPTPSQPSTEPVTRPAAAVVTAEPVDYARIQEWLSEELLKHDVLRTRDLQQIQSQIAYLESLQRSVEKEMVHTASMIQLLAVRSEGMD